MDHTPPDAADLTPGRLHLEHSGQGDPLVFVHGMGSSSATWAACRAALDTRYETIAVDLLGHGRSPVPDDPAEYRRDAALTDLDEIVAALGRRPVLIGHSLGGYLSLAFAATRPGRARALVVLNTGPGFRDPVKREAWNERSRRNAHRFGVPVQVAELNLQEDSVVMDRLTSMLEPVLVLAGSLDRPEYAASGEYLARRMPSATLEIVEGGEHSMHEATHAVDVAERIDRFVRTLPPA